MPEETNPQPIVTLTARAIEEVRVLQARPENANKSLRVFVEQGGCSGMQYSLVFDESREGDEMSGSDGIRVLIDSFSAKYIRGAVVDYSDSLTSGGFQITNPNARESCGCGKSFTT